MSFAHICCVLMTIMRMYMFIVHCSDTHTYSQTQTNKSKNTENTTNEEKDREKLHCADDI